MTKRRWLWILLFILAVTILGILATGLNVVVVRDYQKLLDLARTHSQQLPQTRIPWLTVVLGTSGFLAAIAALVVFFFRLLQEMRLNQLQSEFLAAVSHELKTPIATMELSSSLLKEATQPEEIASLWDSHDEELKRLKFEVETLLEAARWDSHAVSTRRTSIRMENWIQESFERWKKILGPSAVLIREGEPFDFEARVDLRLLSLIADNLMDNARKFSRDQTAVKITTHLIAPHSIWGSSRWRMEIQDQGWGFDPSDSGKIFKRFFRSRNKAPQAVAGTGLGLYLAASACRAMGLKITGRSSGTGQGATFTLEGKRR
ncbi:MAG: HAMP domain-containing histidine kinase [Methylotenera sp.]|nr:HAMP domain-containing histidine kinase [Oligoflexia bacterium]